jgi:preprotein translocase subunit SecG
MLSTFVNIVHIFVCCVLMFVVLLQQGKGGGMGSAFGGASAQVFGGSGAGNILTRATAICAAIFMLTSVTLAYMSSSGDRALRAKVAEEQSKVKDRGEKRAKTDATAAPSGSGAAAPSGGMMNAPAPSPKDSAPTPAP